MADKEFEIEDPFEPVAVALSTPGFDGVEAMARCFVEEFAMMGWPPERIYRLFTVPDFAASYAFYADRGSAAVRHIIASVLGEDFPEPVEGADEVLLRLTPVSRRANQGDSEGIGEEDQNASGL